MKSNQLFFFGFVMLLLFSSVCASTSAKQEVKYLKTSDGDTARFVVDGENIRVRFLGINTPEVSGENKVEEPYGKEAMEYTKRRLESAKKIEIEYDQVADKEDRFGRKLAWIWVDDELFELELLRQGLAKTYMLKKNYQYAAELKEAEKEAKQAEIGVWSKESENTNNNQSTIAESSSQPIVTYEAPTKPKAQSQVGVSGSLIGVIVIVIIFIILKMKKDE